MKQNVTMNLDTKLTKTERDFLNTNPDVKAALKRLTSDCKYHFSGDNWDLNYEMIFSDIICETFGLDFGLLIIKQILKTNKDLTWGSNDKGVTVFTLKSDKGVYMKEDGSLVVKKLFYSSEIPVNLTYIGVL